MRAASVMLSCFQAATLEKGEEHGTRRVREAITGIIGSWLQICQQVGGVSAPRCDVKAGAGQWAPPSELTRNGLETAVTSVTAVTAVTRRCSRRWRWRRRTSACPSN